MGDIHSATFGGGNRRSSIDLRGDTTYGTCTTRWKPNHLAPSVPPLGALSCGLQPTAVHGVRSSYACNFSDISPSFCEAGLRKGRLR